MQVFFIACVTKAQFSEIMDCNKVDKYLEEEFSDGKESLPEEIKIHINDCSKCQQSLSIQMNIAGFVERRKNIEIDDFFTQRVISSIQNQTPVHQIKQRNFLINSRVAAAIAVFLFSIVLGIFAGRFTAEIYSNSNNSTYDELTSAISYGITDNSFDLINFDE